MTWPFGHLRTFGYDVIVADPPWDYELWSAKGAGKSAQNQYDCMPLDDIKALPVGHLARRDCALFLWATAPMLPQGLDVLQAWGFAYKSAAVWHKKTVNDKTAFGTGYLFRSAAEFLLLGTVGQPRFASRSERNLFEGLRREHSRKPDESYQMIGRLFPQGYRCELFSRTDRAGWDTWGNQAGTFLEKETAQ